MGNAYRLAGVVAQGGGWRVVRPLLVKRRGAPVRTIGWAARFLNGQARWDLFEPISPEPAAVEPPHVEDLWVRAFRQHKESDVLQAVYQALDRDASLDDVRRLIHGTPSHA
jgi:hypothetical protein